MCSPDGATEARVGHLELNCKRDAAVHGLIKVEVSVGGHDDKLVVHLQFSEQKVHSRVGVISGNENVFTLVEEQNLIARLVLLYKNNNNNNVRNRSIWPHGK